MNKTADGSWVFPPNGTQNPKMIPGTFLASGFGELGSTQNLKNTPDPFSDRWPFLVVACLLALVSGCLKAQ